MCSILASILLCLASAPAYVSVNVNVNLKTVESYTIPIELSNYLHDNNLTIVNAQNNPTVTKTLSSIHNNKVVGEMHSGNMTVVHKNNPQQELFLWVFYAVSLKNTNGKTIFTFTTGAIYGYNILRNEVWLLHLFTSIRYGSILYWLQYRNDPIVYDVTEFDTDGNEVIDYIQIDSYVNVFHRVTGVGYHAWSSIGLPAIGSSLYEGGVYEI